MGSKNNWDADAMRGTLISDMENEVREGIRKTNTEQQGATSAPSGSAASVESVTVPHQPSDISHQPSDKEPTKGVQTYIPMSMYRRLNDIKLTRRENIAALVAQAIALWLDVQEGKAQVNKVI